MEFDHGLDSTRREAGEDGDNDDMLVMGGEQHRLAEFEAMRTSSLVRRETLISGEGSRLKMALNLRQHLIELDNQVGHILGAFKCRNRDLEMYEAEQQAALVDAFPGPRSEWRRQELAKLVETALLRRQGEAIALEQQISDFNTIRQQYADLLAELGPGLPQETLAVLHDYPTPHQLPPGLGIQPSAGPPGPMTSTPNGNSQRVVASPLRSVSAALRPAPSVHVRGPVHTVPAHEAAHMSGRIYPIDGGNQFTQSQGFDTTIAPAARNANGAAQFPQTNPSDAVVPNAANAAGSVFNTVFSLDGVPVSSAAFPNQFGASAPFATVFGADGRPVHVTPHPSGPLANQRGASVREGADGAGQANAAHTAVPSVGNAAPSLTTLYSADGQPMYVVSTPGAHPADAPVRNADIPGAPFSGQDGALLNEIHQLRSSVKSLKSQKTVAPTSQKLDSANGGQIIQPGVEPGPGRAASDVLPVSTASFHSDSSSNSEIPIVSVHQTDGEGTSASESLQGGANVPARHRSNDTNRLPGKRLKPKKSEQRDNDDSTHTKPKSNVPSDTRYLFCSTIFDHLGVNPSSSEILRTS
jgi:hypothetical protein